jgi:archaellin
MKELLVLVAAFVLTAAPFAAILVLAACRVSGRCSEMERKEEGE